MSVNAHTNQTEQETHATKSDNDQFGLRIINFVSILMNFTLTSIKIYER